MALAAGYLLGRRHRSRLAFMLGAAALTGRLSGAPGQLVRSGTKLLGSSGGLGKAASDALGEAAGKAVPGLGDVGDMIRQDLTSVAKRAVATAVSNQIESLSDQLHDRAEAIREQSAGPGKKTGGAPPDDEADGGARPAQRRRVPRQRDAGNGRAESRGDEPAGPEDEELAGAQDEELAGAEDEELAGAEDEELAGAEDEELAGAEDEEPAERAPRSGAASRGGAALRSGARAGRSAQAGSPIRRTRR
jgi:hypothetical protein